MMSDSDNRDYFNSSENPRGELLDELGSLKALLDEEIAHVPPVTSVSEISSVKDYMLLKQKAESTGLSLDAYLAQRAAEQPPSATEEDADNDIPMLDEVVEISAEDLPPTSYATEAPTYEASPYNDAPVTEEVYESPAISVSPAAFAGTTGVNLNLEELEQRVNELVEQRLRELKPQLEKQIFDEIRNGLPYDFFN